MTFNVVDTDSYENREDVEAHLITTASAAVLKAIIIAKALSVAGETVLVDEEARGH